MYKRASLFVIVASACGGHAPPPAPVTPPVAPVTPPIAPVAPVAPACIDATAALESAVVTAHGVSLCAAGTAHTCWSIDLATAAWTAQPALASGDPDPAPVVKADVNPIQVCAAGGSDCASVTVPGLAVPPEGAAFGAATPDRALVAVWTQASLRVFAVKGGKALATIKGWRTPMGQGGVMTAAFAGNAIAVLASYSPVSSVGKLFDPHSGKAIGTLGAPDKNGVAEIAEIAPVATGVADQWAFLDFSTSRLFVHDTRRGKLVRTVELFDAQDAQLAGDTGHDAPGQSGLFAPTHDGASIVVVPHAIGAWPMVIVDGATGKATKLRGPRCS